MGSEAVVAGTWVGGEGRWIRFRSLRYGQGAFMARPFFHEFLRRLEASPDMDCDSNARFFRPPGGPGMEMDCEEYDKAPPPLEEGEFENEAFSEEFSF